MHGLPSNIICPIDMGEHSAVALRYAGLIASKLGASVHVLHAHMWAPPAEFTAYDTDQMMAEYKEWRTAELSEVHDFVQRQIGGLHADVELVESDIVEALRSGSEESDADFVVLSTHGRGGLDRMVFGSVTEEILKRVHKPVLAIRVHSCTPPTEETLFRSILCPVNFTEVAEDTLRYACAFSAEFASKLDVVYALEPRSLETEQSVREKLCTWVPEMTHQDCKCDLVVKKGHAAEEILRRANQEKADLIVIGAQQTAFLGTTLFGTTTERVIRHANCPVLVVPRAEKESQ